MTRCQINYCQPNHNAIDGRGVSDWAGLTCSRKPECAEFMGKPITQTGLAPGSKICQRSVETPLPLGLAKIVDWLLRSARQNTLGMAKLVPIVHFSWVPREAPRAWLSKLSTLGLAAANGAVKANPNAVAQRKASFLVIVTLQRSEASF